MADPPDVELLKDLRGLGKPPLFRRKPCRVSRLSPQLPNPHEPRQHNLSTVDRQVRSRAESDVHGSSESAGRCYLKCCKQMYCSLALIAKGSVRTLVRSVEESNGAEGCRLIHKQICARHSDSTVRFGAEDHDACETLVWPRCRF